ncbi:MULTISPECIES: hypothetical protein [Paenibacillus]|uniref:DUF4044 domain-containing protein n=1 Tax=Paenibacillus residui TaxID=629724 RepID=A0ABW3D9Y1_9BACL|nr:hypothetical protein [Paenibacillus sp. 32O-W]
MKRKPMPYSQRKTKEEVNKKAIIWAGGIFAAIVILMAVLLIVNS